MDKGLLESYARQFPIATAIVILGWIAIKFVVAYWVKRDEAREAFFIKEMEKKDAIIHEKDEDIKALNMKLVDVTQRFIEVTLKNNDVITGVKELLRDVVSKI